MRTSRSLGILVGAFILCQGASVTLAQELTDEQRATALFAEARAAFVEGDYATACPKYEEVVRIKPGLGARIGLGDCYRAQGRLAKAWETYQSVVAEVPEVVKKAKGLSEQSKAKKRGEEAQARIKEIEPRLGWMTIVVPESMLGVQDFKVLLDDVAVAREKFGVRLPVDRGEHVIDGTAPGKKTWEKTVAIGEGAELTVTVQPLDEEAPAAKPDLVVPSLVKTGPGPGGAIVPVGGDQPPPDMNDPVVGKKNDFFSTQRVVGLGLGIVGLGAVVAGSAFGLQAIEKRDASEENGHCSGNECDAIGLPLRQASYDAGNASTGFFIGGGVALAAGFALFLTAPKRAPVQAAVVLGPSSLHCIGRF